MRHPSPICAPDSMMAVEWIVMERGQGSQPEHSLPGY
jgi:hypothetical protein